MKLSKELLPERKEKFEWIIIQIRKNVTNADRRLSTIWFTIISWGLLHSTSFCRNCSTILILHFESPTYKIRLRKQHSWSCCVERKRDLFNSPPNLQRGIVVRMQLHGTLSDIVNEADGQHTIKEDLKCLNQQKKCQKPDEI